jgi:hypothetical protein
MKNLMDALENDLKIQYAYHGQMMEQIKNFIILKEQEKQHSKWGKVTNF